jgi:hypothetical protein
MPLRSIEKPAVLTRRQAIHSAGKVLAGVVSPASIPSLSADAAQDISQALDQVPKQPGELSQLDQFPSAAEKLRFPVTADVAANANYVLGFMRDAASQGAHVLHTSEACLTGHAGQDVQSFDNFDWTALRKEISRQRVLASELKIYLVLGSAHSLNENTKPTNCVIRR